MSKIETVKRYLTFIAGLFFIALGVAFTKHAELGVSPISSVANIMSCKFTFFTIGTWLIVWNCVMIIGQILILRKKFQIIQLLQLPLSFLFGYFTDLGMMLVTKIPVNSYFAQLALVIIGVVILAFGIALSVIANVILNSGEAFVKAISDTSGKAFGDVKIAFDIACVVITVVLSLMFFGNRIEGVREGTLISAVFVGMIVKVYNKIIKKPLDKFLSK